MTQENPEAPPQTLSTTFAAAEKVRHKLSSFASSSDATFQAQLESAIKSYSDCLKLADSVALFSPNEDLEDVNTNSIRYLLLPFHLAELKLKRTGGERKQHVLEARRDHESFIKQLDAYDALSSESVKLWEQYREQPNQFTTANTTDATKRRETKVRRFKEEKELKMKLDHLSKDNRAEGKDEEAVREVYLTELAYYVYQTWQSLESIALELQMLSFVPPTPTASDAMRDSRDPAQGGKQDGYSERLDGDIRSLLANGKGGPILSKDGRPMRPFTLLDSRQRLRDGVFRPDHNLPTMTIDEYLEEEKRRGGIIEGGGPQSGMKPEPNEDDFEAADAETIKARKWDDYKDENPRGAGNTMNMG